MSIKVISKPDIGIKSLDFKPFQLAIQRQFNKMKDYPLFKVDVDQDTLWNIYLDSFPEGTNPIYKERTEHDCNCCKSFIRKAGSMIAIIDGKIVSIWDIKDKSVDENYHIVAKALSKAVKSRVIANKFLHWEHNVGVETTRSLLDDGEVETWSHFHVKLPNKFVVNKEYIQTQLSHFKSTRDVFLRSLNELTMDAIDTILDLIAQNSLYRGSEHKFAIESFRKLKVKFDRLKTDREKEIFSWSLFDTIPVSVSKIKNTAIGTLLVNLSEDMELETAVKKYENVVAPSNYKRPTALITKTMIKKAQETINELGLASALERRYAILEDININDIIFANKEAKKRLDGDIFDDLIDSTSDRIKNLDKVEEITIEDFINKIVPRATSLEIMLENKHANNLVSLIAPEDLTAKHLFKWNNNFSWSYTGDLADSIIKDRVKSKGGKVDGDIRCSLSWFNYDDLDIYIIEPDGNRICYSSKKSNVTGGFLDIDMNAGSGNSRSAVENIAYPDKNKMIEGKYILGVHNFRLRETKDVGFDVEVEFDGVIHSFHYPKMVKNNERIKVAEITYSKKEGISIKPLIPSSKSIQDLWGLPTQSFHKVSVMMISPNHWGGLNVGNKHYFFMLNGCVNDGQARGFYNEFLNEDLNKHRKVLEIVGSRKRVKESDNQLSGIGFSSTQKNSVLCRVTGKFTRVLKIIF